MSLDYSKWDAVASEVDNEDRRAKEELREKNRKEYLAMMAEKQKQAAEQIGGDNATSSHANTDGKDSTGHNHNHGTDHHSHGHGHNHNHNHSASRPTCGCGFADPEQLMKMYQEREKEKEKNPPVSEEELVIKKMKAAEAAREHGGILYREGKYTDALAVYERGILILSGITSSTPEQDSQNRKLEGLLDLNMSACCLKLKQWNKAIEHCKLSLRMVNDNPKAYFRWGQALVGMGEYDDAVVQYNKAKDLAPNDVEIQAHIEKALKAKANSEAIAQQKMMALAQKLKKNNNITNNPMNTSSQQQGDDAKKQEEKVP